MTVVLNAQSRLIAERLGKVGRVDRLKQFAVHHVHHHRRRLSAGLVSVGRHHHLVHQYVLFLHHEVQVNRIFVAHHHRLSLRGIAHELHLQRVFACRHVFQAEVAVVARNGAHAVFNNQYSGVGQTFLCVFLNNVSCYYVALFHRVRLNGTGRPCRRAHKARQ